MPGERRAEVSTLPEAEQHSVAERHKLRIGPCQLEYIKFFNMENVHYELIITHYSTVHSFINTITLYWRKQMYPT